ncbi:hypothetical protein SLS62_006579 [Diatrype stigma]|uniref:Pentatricopeptide repeat-containing protein n=1 Tax=Diatrype stigma TaxID=117547 RepID=A0AAN9UMG1_9PEZI
MFQCRACFKRALGTLFDHAFPSKGYRPLWHPRVAIVEPRQARRKYATTSATGPRIRKLEASDEDKRPRKTDYTPVERAAYRQLQNMEDPFHIAKYVNNILEKDRFDEAAEITRKASKDKSVTVSWNALIDYQLRQGSIHAGIKLYNEMKKRSQLPNAQTYTIIFRACAESTHAKLAVTEAIRLYNQMLSRDRLNPNTIHMNAVVKVCAKANDIESMFTILKTANDGLRTPNNMTYTTILNALRAQVDTEQHRDKTEAEVQAEVKTTISRAKTIWDEIISRWRQNHVVIDEELVCAMGRILLLGNYRDIDSIGDLIEQTMTISKNPESGTDSKAGKEAAKKEEAGKALGAPDSQTQLDLKTKEPGVPSSAAKAATDAGAPSIAYARPGKNSLSLALHWLEKTGKTSQAIRYWGIITRNYAVAPDAENWYRLMSAFRLGRNSARAPNYLRNMPRAFAAPKHFRAAMRACLRDCLNAGAFDHATTILWQMVDMLHHPDPPTMRTYLRTAYACKRHFEKQSAQPGQFEAARQAYGRQLETALRKLEAPYRAVADHAQADALVRGGESAESWEYLALRRAELVALARKMIATADRLVTENLVTDAESLKRLKSSRNLMNRMVVIYFERRLAFEPAFQKERPDGSSEVDRADAREDRADDWDDKDEDRTVFFLDKKARGTGMAPPWTPVDKKHAFAEGYWDRMTHRRMSASR